MADHYRTLVQSLMQLGFLFRRLGERKQEVWKNRLTDQEVMFDRQEVSVSRTAAEEVVKQAKTAKPGRKSPEKAAAPSRSASKGEVAAAGAATKSVAKATSGSKRKPSRGRRGR